jgi:bifunctional DNase/RNase
MSKSTSSQLVEMTIDKVVSLHKDQNQTSHFVVLNELGGDRRLTILIGSTEAIDLVASLEELNRGRPFSPQFTAGLLQAAGGHVRRVRIDRLIDVPELGVVYGATVEVEGASAVNEADARPSDALNLAAVVRCPVAVTVEVLEEAAIRHANDSSEADLLRRSFDAEPMRMWRQAG